MTQQSGLWGRLRALIEGEVPASTLEAYRRAGGPAYDLQWETEERWHELQSQGVNPWAVDAVTQAWMLCAWNAFVLQTLADQFLEADYRVEPATVGFVPPVTAEQTLAFYTQVPAWLSRAHQARTDPAYRIDVALPADLPPWSEVEPCPRSHLEGMLAATRLLAPHAETVVGTFNAAGAPAEKQAVTQRLGALLADARTKAEYAERMYARDVPQELHEEIERHAKEALERFYQLGQLVAMPALAEAAPPATAPAPERAGAARGRLPLPGEPGFDPWCLTDPESRADWQRDRQAREAIGALWEYDPDPRRTVGIQQEIDEALARGDIDHATDRSGKRLGFYFCCPWASIYVVKRPVTIGGRRLRTLQEFTFDVSAEEMSEGGEFKREILVGSFQPTRQLDYCNLRAGGHGSHHD